MQPVTSGAGVSQTSHREQQSRSQVWTGWVLFEFHLGVIEHSYVLQQEDKSQQVHIRIKIQAVASCKEKLI